MRPSLARPNRLRSDGQATTGGPDADRPERGPVAGMVPGARRLGATASAGNRAPSTGRTGAGREGRREGRREGERHQRTLRRQDRAGLGAMSAGAAAGGGGLAAAGVASMVAGTPGWAPAVLAAAGVAAAGGLFRVGYRAGQRARLSAAAGVAAAGQLGLSGGARASGRPVVEARAWRGTGIGSPRLVTVHVPRHLDLDDTDHAGVAAAVGAVFGAAYRVQRCSRGRLLLRRHTPTPAAPVDPVIARVHRTVAEMLGTTARVTKLQLGGSGQPEQFDVHLDSGNRVVAEAWRARAERSLSTMLPGRWRARWDLERDRVHFELRPSLPERLPNPGITDADRRAGSRLPFGVDENGSTVYWQMETSPHMVVTGSTGVGKALALDTPIRTDQGWATMGELQAGARVFDELGEPCTVQVVHPVQLDRPCYDVSFSDGSTIIADADHLWVTTTRAERVQQARPLRGVVAYTANEIGAVAEATAAAAQVPDVLVSSGTVIRELGQRYQQLVYRAARQIGPSATISLEYDRTPHRGPSQKVSRPVPGYSRQLLLKALLGWMQTPTNADRVLDHESLVTTAQIAATLTAEGHYANHSVVVAGALHLPHGDLPIDPYLLGCWLGDGATHNATVFTADQEIVTAFTDAGYPVTADRSDPYAYRIGGGFRSQLRQLGVFKNKHVPSAYLNADIPARQALTAGLLDTDGWVQSGHGHRFCTTSARLRDAAVELIQGLGLQCRVTSRAVQGRSPASSTAWNITFAAAPAMFRLTRKRTRVPSGPSRETNARRYITAARPIPSVPVRCITVDSPSRLYLAGRSLIPTHNTVAVNGLLAGASNLGWPIRVCDPKRIEFLGMRDWPNVQIVATTVEEMVTTIHDSWQLMEKRYRLIEQGKASEDDFEPTVLVLDEYRDMVALVDDWWTSVIRPGVSAKLKLPTKCPVYGWVGSLARKGRSARVHVVLGTQRPDAEFLGGEMRDNFRARLSLGRLSPQGAQMMWEAPFIGVAVPAVRGRGTAAAGPFGVPTEAQVYWTPDPRRATSPEDRELLAELRPAEVIHPRQEVVWGDNIDFANPIEVESIVWLRVRNAHLANLPPGVDPDADNQDDDDQDDDITDGEAVGENSADPAVANADREPSAAGGVPSTAGSTSIGDASPGARRGHGKPTPEQPIPVVDEAHPRGIDPAGDDPAGEGGGGGGGGDPTPTGRAAWTARRRPGRSSRAVGGASGQVVDLAAHRHQAPPTAPADDAAQEVSEWGSYDSAAEGGYIGTETVAPSSLQPGDLLEVPVEGVDTWAVIIDVAPDIEDELAYAIDYLTDDGVDGTWVVPDDDLVHRRSPSDGS